MMERSEQINTETDQKMQIVENGEISINNDIEIP